MIVYLLRHGETEYNLTKQYTGTLDIPVSAAGLAKLSKADFDTQIVYTSTLCRSQQTARVLFPNAKLVAIDALKEMCFGELEGQHYDLSADKHGAGFASDAKGGETRDAYCHRTCEAFSKLITDAIDSHSSSLVIVAHGGTQMAVLSAYADEHRTFEQWCGRNGGGFVLDVDPTVWQKEKRLSVLREIIYCK